MKNKEYLTVRQEELMNFLWRVNEPMTANEMAEKLETEGWNNVTLFKTVQSLTNEGYLDVVGLEKTVKTYARKLAPAISKNDYYASVLKKRGVDSSSIGTITAVLIGADKKSPEEKDAAVIAELERIISRIRQKECVI
ncbi:MAG: BlaI/MecI/CopY family transcriptional regulator [Agathobacter sp.]|nr:BlaI/MecI/CopY family transcriptional regulator [Agathobacter sp.]